MMVVDLEGIVLVKLLGVHGLGLLEGNKKGFGVML